MGVITQMWRCWRSSIQTFAMQAVVAYWRRHKERLQAGLPRPKREPGDGPGGADGGAGASGVKRSSEEGADGKRTSHEGDDDDDDEDDDEAETHPDEVRACGHHAGCACSCPGVTGVSSVYSCSSKNCQSLQYSNPYLYHCI